MPIKAKRSTSPLIHRLFLAVRAAFVVQIIGVGLAYILNVLLARWLGPLDYGSYLFVTNLLMATSVFASLGLRQSSVKFTPEFISEAHWDLLKGYLWLIPRLTLILGTLIMVILLTLLIVAPPENIALSLLLIGVPLLPFYALMEVGINLLRSLGYVGYALALDRILRPITILMLVLLSLWLLPSSLPTGLMVIASLWVSVLLVLILAFYQCRKHIRRQIVDWRHVKPKFNLKHWLATSIRLILAMSKAIAVDRLPVLAIGILLGAGPTALYGVAFKIATLARFGTDAVHHAYAPQVAPLYASGDMATLSRTLVQVTRWSLWSTLALCAGLFILGEFLLTLFGTDYVTARSVMYLGLVAQAVRSLFGPVVYLLNLTGHENLSMRVSIYMTAMTLLLLPPAILLFGLTGAAAVVILVELIGNLWFYSLVRLHLGIDAIPPELRWLPTTWIADRFMARSI